MSFLSTLILIILHYLFSSCHIPSRNNSCHAILFYSIHPISSHPAEPYLTCPQSNLFVLLVLLHPNLHHLILCNTILYYTILSYFILSHPLILYLIFMVNRCGRFAHNNIEWEQHTECGGGQGSGTMAQKARTLHYTHQYLHYFTSALPLHRVT